MPAWYHTCVCVCLSQVETAGRFKPIFGKRSTYPTLCYKESRISVKNKGTYLWNFAPNSVLRENLHLQRSPRRLLDSRYYTLAAHVDYYTSVNRTALTPLHWHVVDLLYNLFLSCTAVDKILTDIGRRTGGSVAEWLACWTQVVSRAWVHIAAATLSGNSLRQIVHTRRTSVHQAALLRVASK